MKVFPYDAVIEAQRVARQTPEAKAARGRRKGLVEGVFGTIKTVLRGAQFTTRGLVKVEAEWVSLVTGLNLRTLHRHWQTASAAHRRTMLAAGA